MRASSSPACEEVLPRPPVVSLEPLERPLHRLRRRVLHEQAPLALLLVGRRLDPAVRARRHAARRSASSRARSPRSARRRAAGAARDEAGAVLAAHAVDDDRRRRRRRSPRARAPKSVAVTLEEVECTTTRSAPRRRRPPCESSNSATKSGVDARRARETWTTSMSTSRGGSSASSSGQRRSTMRVTPCSASERQPASVSGRMLSERTTRAVRASAAVLGREPAEVPDVQAALPVRVASRGGGLGAEVRLDHRRVALHLVRRALGDLAAEVEHVDALGDRPSRAPCGARRGARSGRSRRAACG